MSLQTGYGALYLDGPLQSWGYQSRYDERTSLAYPTRSAIIGLLCAASGIDREQSDELHRIDDGIPCMSVAVLQRGKRLVDYHTVGGGAPKNSGRMPVKASGDEFGTVVTRREYLADAKFGIVIQGATTFLNDLGRALENPRWGVWLGRKSCVPAMPLWHGVFDNDNDAWDRILDLYRERTSRDLRGQSLRFIADVDSFEKGTDTLRDRPVDFSSNHRRFASRRVSVEVVEM